MRAGFLSVRRTEMEAAETLGMSPAASSCATSILPHIAKTIYPRRSPTSSSDLVLGTSMAAVFGVDELTGRAINIIDRELPLRSRCSSSSPASMSC